LELNLDGSGNSKIKTGINFLDHLLSSFALHGLFDLNIKAEGNRHVDDHHLVEDIGITLGQALVKALGDKKGITRVGSVIVPMDDALILTSIDLSGRAYVDSDLEFERIKIGDLTSEMINHFLRSFATSGQFNLHIHALRGSNDHHKAEAVFKALGRALSQAVELNPRLKGRIPSEKGVL
jgi:imidazoleglycerol-phosphate dehydratase